MSADINEIFGNSGIKISEQNLKLLENKILEKIMSTNGQDIIKKILSCESNSEAVNKMRHFFINPELYGIIHSDYFAPEIFTLTTKSNNSHFEGLILNSKGFGIVYGEADIHYATTMNITYLNLYTGANTLKTTLKLNKDISNSKILTGTWKTEENNLNLTGLTYSSSKIQEDTNRHSTFKDLHGTIDIENNNQNFSDAMIHNRTIATFIIENYKSHLSKLK